MQRLAELQAQQAAAKRAYEAKLDYLYSPEYDLSKGTGELDRIYRETFAPTLVSSQPTTQPTTQPGASTPVTTAPVAPRPPIIPAPVLPTTPSPSGNLLPQPLIGSAPVGGIPQPTFGALPQYQSPTFQATQPMQQPQQQQIQYGPIGQGAVGQASLLSTLLSQQQDPTKVSLLGFDNPYLMKPFG